MHHSRTVISSLFCALAKPILKEEIPSIANWTFPYKLLQGFWQKPEKAAKLHALKIHRITRIENIKRINTRLWIEYYLWQFHSSLKRTVIYNWSERSHWKLGNTFLSIMVTSTPKYYKGKVLSSFKIKVLDLLLPCFYIHNVALLKLSKMIFLTVCHQCPWTTCLSFKLFSKISLPSKITLWPVWPT